MATTKKKGSNKFIDQLYYNDDQRRLAKLVTGFSFDMFIMFVILADAVVLGLLTSPTMEFYFDNGLFLLDRVFMGIFMAEMFLKILALKKKFFTSGWNVFDLLIVVVSSLPFMSAFIVLRTFRLFRLLKYVDRFSKINNLVKVFLDLLPSFFSFTLDGWASSIARPVMLIYPHAWIFFSAVILVSFLLVVSFVVSSIKQILCLLKEQN